jgi:hypothetical protein
LYLWNIAKHMVDKTTGKYIDPYIGTFNKDVLDSLLYRLKYMFYFLPEKKLAEMSARN